MTEFMGWRQTTSSDNFKQYLVSNDTTLDNGTILKSSDILILVPSDDGDIFYKRNDHNSEIDPNGFKITDHSILTELPKSKIHTFGKEINDVIYKFLKGDFINIFKPSQPLHPDIRKAFMDILETIIKSYDQSIETGGFKLKPESERDLPFMEDEDRGNYESLIGRLGENLDYIHMAINLGQISSEIYGNYTQARIKSNRKKRRKPKRKKTSKKKKSKKSKKPKKSSKKKKH